MDGVKRVKVTLYAELDDGSVVKTTYNLEPGSVQVMEARDVVPVLAPGGMSVAELVVAPHTHRLTVVGLVADDEGG